MAAPESLCRIFSKLREVPQVCDNVMMITHRQIEAFREVMRNGSVTSAAEYLQISQPAVSRLIRDLEVAVDFPLFSRHGSRVVPTPAAHEFWEVVERSFLGLNYLGQTAQRIRAGGNSTLSVAAAPVFAATLLADAITEIVAQGALADHASVQITTLPVVRQVALRRAELGVNLLSHHQHEVDLVATYSLPFCVIAAAGHRFASGDTVRLSDLAQEAYVGFDEATVTGQMQDRLFSTMRHAPRIVLRSYLANVVSAFVLRGFGVSIVDPWTAMQHRAQGGVCLPFESREELHLALIKPLGARVSPAGEALVAAIDRQIHRLREA